MSYTSLKTIRFEGELLPNWAQLLDLAAKLCEVPADTRRWFSRLTNTPGVEDARTVLFQCTILRDAIRAHKDDIARQLQETNMDGRQPLVLAAWEYSLDTMIQAASSRATCSWHVEGIDNNDTAAGDGGGGDITLRRP